eukprot:1781270-Pyramimonas_sp.AAC.1
MVLAERKNAHVRAMQSPGGGGGEAPTRGEGQDEARTRVNSGGDRSEVSEIWRLWRMARAPRPSQSVTEHPGAD